jgi:tetratricopeptide (TPR) repeat protein
MKHSAPKQAPVINSGGRRLWIIACLLTLYFAFWVYGCASRPIQGDAPESTPGKSETTVTTSSKDQVEIHKQESTASRTAEASAEYHFAMAQAYVAEGNPDRAIEEYKLTLVFDPDSALVYARLSTEYIKKGMLSAAMETCKEALRRDPKFVDARLMLAGLYSTSRDYSAALVEYDRILQTDPKHEEAVVYKAQTLLETGRSSHAIRLLNSFLKNNPEAVMVWYYLGRAEQHDGRFKESSVAYKKALELRSAFPQAALALGYLYEEKQMNAQAIQVYKALFESTQDSSAANRIATLYLKEEKYEEARPFLEAIEAADPEDMNVRVKLGLIEMELKHYEKAIALFKKILEVNPDSDRVRYYLGSIYEETKEVDLAITELRQIKPDSRLFADAALHVAYLYRQTERIDHARTFISEAIKKSPRVPGFHIFRASLEEDSKNFSGAVVILEAAVRQFPEDEKIRYYLGSIYERRGDVDKGLEQMEAILAINPQNVDALNYIGYTLTTRGVRLNDAEKMLRKAIGLRPDNGYIQDSWGWHLFVRGRVSEAIVELEKAAKLKPNEATILEHLGDAYLHSNLREKAMQQYQDAAKFAEDDTVRKKIQMKIDNLHQELAQGGKVAPSARSPAAQPSGSVSPSAIPDVGPK